MRKGIIQKLTMLAFVAMVGIPAFAQGGKFGTNAGVATTIGFHPSGTVFDYKELKLEVTEESPYMVEVIGFSDAVKANPSLLDGSDERFVEKTLVIPHVIEGGGGDPTTIFEGVRANAFAEVDADLVSMVTSLQIDYNASYVASNPGTPLTAIGENAFAGLEALESVVCYAPTANDIPLNSFADDVFAYTDLIFPEGEDVVISYSAAKGWNKFLFRYAGEALMGDSDDDGEVTTADIDFSTELYMEDEYDVMFDFDGDGVITISDIDFLVVLYMNF